MGWASLSSRGDGHDASVTGSRMRSGQLVDSSQRQDVWRKPCRACDIDFLGTNSCRSGHALAIKAEGISNTATQPVLARSKWSTWKVHRSHMPQRHDLKGPTCTDRPIRPPNLGRRCVGPKSARPPVFFSWPPWASATHTQETPCPKPFLAISAVTPSAVPLCALGHRCRRHFPADPATQKPRSLATILHLKAS
jgi:hypothetical protein